MTPWTIIVIVAAGWATLSVGFIIGCWWVAAHPDPATCHNCEQVVERMSAELATETRQRRRHAEAADYYSRVVARQRWELDRYKGYASMLERRVDALEHEQAIDTGTTLAEEAERFLAEGGGS